MDSYETKLATQEHSIVAKACEMLTKSLPYDQQIGNLTSKYDQQMEKLE